MQAPIPFFAPSLRTAFSLPKGLDSNKPGHATGWRLSAAETTNDDTHIAHNRLRRCIMALLDDLDQIPPLLPLSLPFGDVGGEENGDQDADELDRESSLGVQ